MNEYVNTKTGAHISTDHTISGGDWELVTNEELTEEIDEELTEEIDEVEDTETVNEESWTVSKLKARLTELGIEFKPKATKAELLELLPE
ncbi:hypothetical protein [Streptococcus uberis]|uniref:hypothetical protein n=1 Tax=Streptococcus uberis TaxID=1349 RepID=UPI001FF51C99|nr:hypothetical protein [Streptococcus uberis]MCK1227510.1 hypothetical protein [Streptococcus uberis]